MTDLADEESSAFPPARSTNSPSPRSKLDKWLTLEDTNKNLLSLE